jgi:hypothetical protein
MRLPIRSSCFAFLVICSACGGEDVKPQSNVKASATITFNDCPYTNTIISGSGSSPTLTDYGATVSSKDGYTLSCTLTPQGTTYALKAHIESATVTLDLRSNDVAAGASMLFYVAGPGGTPDSVESVDANNVPAPTCTLKTVQSDTLLSIGSGTVFAEYDCARVLTPANLASSCHTHGLIYFTGCGS